LILPAEILSISCKVSDRALRCLRIRALIELVVGWINEGLADGSLMRAKVDQLS
jgi:hypothetical protein